MITPDWDPKKRIDFVAHAGGSGLFVEVDEDHHIYAAGPGVMLDDGKVVLTVPDVPALTSALRTASRWRNQRRMDVAAAPDSESPESRLAP